MTLRYDPEIQTFLESMHNAGGSFPQDALHDVAKRRADMVTFADTLSKVIPNDISEEIFHTTIDSDGYRLAIHRYIAQPVAPKNEENPIVLKPAVVHFHGGGFIGLDVPSLATILALQASRTGVQIFSVDYRLAPEHPFPTPVEDCYAGLQWVRSNAERFHIDLKRIAVRGESAGGSLAAGVTILDRERHRGPPIAKQILIYPMLDDRTISTDKVLEPLILWSVVDNITGWTAYLGEKAGKDGVLPVAAPARVGDVEGLPPLYMDVGTLDLFAKEGMTYAARFLAANIEVEFHLSPGLPHGYEGMVPEGEAVRITESMRDRAIQRL